MWAMPCTPEWLSTCMVTLAGFDMKFARAFALVDDLERQISDYLEAQPIETKETTERGSGDLVTRGVSL